mmetsp:Transcript_4942/g.7636  ORF Transcript_4942/g.7636 Transcript_4942/m.7636 type:complete len:87 (+) Transcript_4942:1556-1816(+)
MHPVFANPLYPRPLQCDSPRNTRNHQASFVAIHKMVIDRSSRYGRLLLLAIIDQRCVTEKRVNQIRCSCVSIVKLNEWLLNIDSCM